MPPRSDAEVRTAVERHLGRPLTDKQWHVLVKWGDVGAVRLGAGQVSTLVQQARDMLESYGGETTPKASPPQARARTEIAPSPAGDSYRFTRQDALCIAVAALAAKDPEVIAFRREVLEDQLPTYALDSSREGVEEWIPRQIERERPQLAAIAGEPPLLTYIKVIGHELETTPVAPGGVLDRLRVLGDRLAARYRWAPHAATAFALSGDVIPTIEVLTATIQPNHDVPALTRITLAVDPAATPAAVARAYEQARGRIAEKRARELHPKTYFLAAFAAERTPQESLERQIEEWNRLIPDAKWGYTYDEQRYNFERDRDSALERLVRPAYQLPAQEEPINYDHLFSQSEPDTTRHADREDHEDHEDHKDHKDTP